MDNTENISGKEIFEESPSEFSSERLYVNDYVTEHPVSKYLIPPHPGFPVVEIPGYPHPVKIAYGNVYSSTYPDIEIELEQLS